MNARTVDVAPRRVAGSMTGGFPLTLNWRERLGLHGSGPIALRLEVHLRTMEAGRRFRL